jgi:tetratricopeptide (TPR) repeat protein
MRVRKVLLAYVCTAFLAAPAAVSGAAAAEPTNPTSLIAQGYQSLMVGETTDAISAFSEAIESRELAPEQLASALLNRALAHQQAGQFQAAVDDYAAALRVDALSAELRATALYNRGLAYQKLEEPALAIEDFTSALLLDPHFAHAYFSRGSVLRESGQYLFALSDYEKALRYKHPQAYLVYYGQALAHEQLQHLELAQKLLAKAIIANPSFDLARQRLAALGGVQPQVVAAADTLVTGSVSKTDDDQVVRKEVLPEPVKPPAELARTEEVQVADASATSDAVLGSDPAVAAVKPPKLFTDRVPEEEIEVTPAPPVQSEPTQKPMKAVSKPSQPQVKVVAIEPLPDSEPASDTKTAEVVEPAAADPADAEPAVEASKLTGWSVQISSAKDEKIAWNTWTKLKSRHDILADRKAVVMRADLGAKGIYYRLRLGGFDSRTDAQSLCSKLKSRGVSCFVSKISS